jgi:hypothetical protein
LIKDLLLNKDAASFDKSFDSFIILTYMSIRLAEHKQMCAKESTGVRNNSRAPKDLDGDGFKSSGLKLSTEGTMSSSNSVHETIQLQPSSDQKMEVMSQHSSSQRFNLRDRNKIHQSNKKDGGYLYYNQNDEIVNDDIDKPVIFEESDNDDQNGSP